MEMSEAAGETLLGLPRTCPCEPVDASGSGGGEEVWICKEGARVR